LPNLLFNSFLDLVHYPGQLTCSFLSLFPRSGIMRGAATNRPMGPGHKSSRMSPRRCIQPETHFTPNLPCTQHTTSTLPAPAPSRTFWSPSRPCPPPLTTTQRGLHAPVHAKDQISTLPASTTARHSVATVGIVEPTPQIALSVAVATEVVTLASCIRCAAFLSTRLVGVSDSII